MDGHTSHACPECGSENIQRIVYGIPTSETLDKAEQGEVVLGGCLITEDDPAWCCGDCEHRWGR